MSLILLALAACGGNPFVPAERPDPAAILAAAEPVPPRVAADLPGTWRLELAADDADLRRALDGADASEASRAVARWLGSAEADHPDAARLTAWRTLVREARLVITADAMTLTTPEGERTAAWAPEGPVDTDVDPIRQVLTTTDTDGATRRLMVERLGEDVVAIGPFDGQTPALRWRRQPAE